jgi:hypothetical protein
VIDPSSGNPPAGDGWFYDNYTADLAKTCSKTQPQRVAFTANAKPPTGVTVKLECLNETQKLANTRTDLSSDKQPEIGTQCGMDVMNPSAPMGDEACLIHLNNGGTDDSLFCHPETNTCVKHCVSSTECPPAWVCDDRPETRMVTGDRPYCVNPTCGVDTSG